MDNKNTYWYFQSEFTPDECQKIIDRGLEQLNQNKQKGINTQAITEGNLEKSDSRLIPQSDKSFNQIQKENINLKNVYVRDSEVAWLDDKWIYDLVIPKLMDANSLAGWRYDIQLVESLQFTVYRPGGFYGWHTDAPSDHNGKLKRYIHGITDKPLGKNGKPPEGYTLKEELIGKVRKLSTTINLNTPGDYDGGNLMFDYGHHVEKERYYECTEIRPQGSMIVFPSSTSSLLRVDSIWYRYCYWGFFCLLFYVQDK